MEDKENINDYYYKKPTKPILQNAYDMAERTILTPIEQSPIFNTKSFATLNLAKSKRTLRFDLNDKTQFKHAINYNPIPHLEWADRNELWNHIKAKDFCLTNSNFLNFHADLTENMLEILYDWLSEVSGVLKLKRITLHTSIHLIVAYLSIETNVEKNILQLLGITCLFIAAKLQEIYPPKAKVFAYFTDHACTQKDILIQELLCMQALKWNVNVWTPMDWIGFYYQIFWIRNRQEETETLDVLRAHEKKDPKILINQSGEKNLFTDLLQYDFDQIGHITLRESSKMPYCTDSYMSLPQLAQVLDLCMLNIQATKFKYSILAASILYHFIKFHTAVSITSITGYEVSDLHEANKFTLGYYMETIGKYRTGNQSNSSPLSLPLNLQVASDPFIHTHTIKWDTYARAKAYKPMIEETKQADDKVGDDESILLTNDLNTPKQVVRKSHVLENILTPPISHKKPKLFNNSNNGNVLQKK